MFNSRKASRLIELILVIAGILLLRKPVFGQPFPDAPTRFSIVTQGVTSGTVQTSTPVTFLLPPKRGICVSHLPQPFDRTEAEKIRVFALSSGNPS